MGTFNVTALADSTDSRSKLDWIGGGEGGTDPAAGVAAEGIGTAGVEGSAPETSGLAGNDVAGAGEAENPDRGAISRNTFAATSL